MDTVERLCDNVAIVSDGKVVHEGTIGDLTESSSMRLEDVFIHAVGARSRQDHDALDWLGRR